MGKTSKEKVEKWRRNKENKKKEREKDRVRKAKKKESMTEEEKAELRERNRLIKQKSRMNMSKQKRIGTKLKDRNRKRKLNEDQEQSHNESLDYSTPRVKAFRERQNLVVKLPFKCTNLSRAEKRRAKEASKELKDLKSPSKKVEFVNIIKNSAKSSPRTKKLLEESESQTQISTPKFIETLKGRKDNSSNIARRLITAATLVEQPEGSLKNHAKNIGVGYHTVRKAMKDLEKVGQLKFVDSMKKDRIPFVLTSDAKERIVNFFYEHSRNSPNAKEMILINGNRTAVKYLEYSLSILYSKFTKAFPEMKISQSSFEKVRPKNIKLMNKAKRQVRAVDLNLKFGVKSNFFWNLKICKFYSKISYPLLSTALKLKVVLRILDVVLLLVVSAVLTLLLTFWYRLQARTL